jgi:hypothetical protein
MGQANGLITLLRIIVTLPIAIIKGAWDTPDYLE